MRLLGLLPTTPTQFDSPFFQEKGGVQAFNFTLVVANLDLIKADYLTIPLSKLYGTFI